MYNNPSNAFPYKETMAALSIMENAAMLPLNCFFTCLESRVLFQVRIIINFPLRNGKQ